LAAVSATPLSFDYAVFMSISTANNLGCESVACGGKFLKKETKVRKSRLTVVVIVVLYTILLSATEVKFVNNRVDHALAELTLGPEFLRNSLNKC
jgi:hypothetical protein